MSFLISVIHDNKNVTDLYNFSILSKLELWPKIKEWITEKAELKKFEEFPV